jgi:hypothetical protein
MRFRMPLAITLTALVAACNKTPEPELRSEPKPSASSAAPSGAASMIPTEPTAKAGPSDVTFEAPEGWSKADNPSPMRKATYRIPKAKGDPEDGELSVSQAGGSVEANLKRWTGQFEARTKTERTERQIGPLKVTVVELSGTFTGGGMPGAAPASPKPGWSMLAAIVETTPGLTFFKLTGPAPTVTAAKGDFDKLVGSMKPK